MEKDNAKIAARFVELRTFNDFSTAKMAADLGITEQEYIDFENCKEEIPIWLIYKFAALVNIEAPYIITGKLPSKIGASVVYEGKGQSVERYPGYSFTALAPDFAGKIMNPMLVSISPADSPELVCHKGQEMNFVIEGQLRVIVGAEEFYLRQGDCLYFDPSRPHAQLAMGGNPAKFLTVIAE